MPPYRYLSRLAGFILLLLSVGGPKQAKAQHYFVEGLVGSTIRGGIGPAGTLSFGAGGKVPGSTLRAYALFEGGLSQSTQGAEQRQKTERSYGQLGVRLLWPLPYPPLRFFHELMLGVVHSEGELRRPPDIRLEGSEVSILATLGIGLQLRLLRALSLTVRGQLQYSRDPLTQLRRALDLNQSDLVWLLSAGATCHF